jgi:hypothetical protein
MTVTLAEWEGAGWDTPPLHWNRTAAEPLVACVNGHIAALRGWEVSAEGKVTPSIHCKTPLDDGSICNWHVFTTLEGWAR